MKKICLLISLTTIILFNLSLATEDTLKFGRFGNIYTYYNNPTPSNLVLFVSGDGGWNLGVVDMARSLSSLDAMVVGVNITHYLGELDKSSEKCSYPAGDFEILSKFVQENYKFPNYVTPILVGYSSGATLVYASLVQAPTNTFKGAISLGFCPDLPVTKQFCPGIGLEWTAGPKGKGYSFLPAKSLEVPWVALQGDIDQVCDPAETDKFVGQVKNGEIIQLPKVGHGFSVERNWMPQFKEAYKKVTFTQQITPPPVEDVAVKDLPLVEVIADDTTKNVMAVHITGDGGWGVTDKGISNSLADSGISVIGWNSLKYFWHKKTPEEASLDLGRVLSYYSTAWKKEKIILIGYSMGADVLPFMVNRLPADLKDKIKLIALIGPAHEADFEFHVSNWFGNSPSDKSTPTKPEFKRLKGIKILCFYGADDDDVICRDKDLDTTMVDCIQLPGGHLVKKHFDPITDAILKALAKL